MRVSPTAWWMSPFLVASHTDGFLSGESGAPSPRLTQRLRTTPGGRFPRHSNAGATDGWLDQRSSRFFRPFRVLVVLARIRRSPEGCTRRVGDIAARLNARLVRPGSLRLLWRLIHTESFYLHLLGLPPPTRWCSRQARHMEGEVLLDQEFSNRIPGMLEIAESTGPPYGRHAS